MRTFWRNTYEQRENDGIDYLIYVPWQIDVYSNPRQMAITGLRKFSRQKSRTNRHAISFFE